MIWGVLWACGGGAPQGEVPPVSKVEPVAIEALDEALFGPSERPRLVNFWATWCGPCEAELPHLAAFARSHHDRVDVVMVSLDLVKLAPRVQERVERAELVFVRHLLLDHPDPVMALPQVVPQWPDAVPVTLVVSPEGKVTRRFHRAVSAADLDALEADEPGWWNR